MSDLRRTGTHGGDGFGDGPMKTTLAAAQARAKSAFSDRKAVAGMNASAPVLRAASRMASPRSITVLRPRAADVHALVTGAHVRSMRIGVGIHRDAANPHRRAVRATAAGNLAAVGDQ
jgi:hypothetical protein